ncbi:MAG: hypothetical protein KatS3mg124_1607 [Porticoccaceae bacterium]|nr:MAG: hypothetical protein KatS3mg124_1607 [Porticoccaceae bacterium]
MNHSTERPAVFRQRGLALVAITLILLLVATLGTLAVGRLGVVEQRQAALELRAEEVHAAAVGGLEYAEHWFKEHWDTLSWSDGDGDGAAERGDTATLPSAVAATLLDHALTADTYDRGVLFRLLTPLDASPKIARIEVTAAAQGDTQVRKTVSKEVLFGTFSLFAGGGAAGDPAVFAGPPVLVENCVSGVTGNPAIYPETPGGVAIGTTQGALGCIDPGHFDLNGGIIAALADSQTLWDAVFGAGTTEKDLRALEKRSPERIFFVDDTYPHYPGQPDWNNNNWHADVGSAEEPVILYFDETVDCPKINGDTTIWGLVYYAKAECATNGWGGGVVHGTVAKAGDMSKFTANAEIHGKTLNFGGGEAGSGTEVTLSPVEFVTFAEIPGSWRDF